MLRVTSTVPAYLPLRDLGAQEREEAWAGQYEAVHADLFDIYYAGYGHPGGRAAAAAFVPALAQRVVERESRVLNALEAASADFADRRLMRADQDLDVVLMVGTGGSDAWVSVIEGAPVLFVALEMLTNPERDMILVFHELVPVVHIRALLPLLASQPDLEHHLGMRV